MVSKNCSTVRSDDHFGRRRRITMLGTVIDVLTFEETVEVVKQYIEQKQMLHLVGVNADKINEMESNTQMKEIVNGCGVINADGISVVLASRFLGKPLPERVAGIDLMMRLVELSALNGYSIYLLGAKYEVVNQTARVLKERYPALKIVGVRDGYFKDDEWQNISLEIQEAQPDIVFVGISSPKKEYLIQYFQDRSHKGVFMGVGGSFDVISGNIPRAPLWVQKCGMEWAFRVIQEPRRLFKRYFVGNFKFIWSVLREKFSGTK